MGLPDGRMCVFVFVFSFFVVFFLMGGKGLEGGDAHLFSTFFSQL